MEKIKVISQGYTITVTSWENDGDNYRTKFIVVSDKELALAIANMCSELFTSKNNRESAGIGNSFEDERPERDVIKYMKAHPELYKDKKIKDDDTLVDICREYNYDLMGGSEYYYSRVCEKCVVHYSAEDIYADLIFHYYK